MSINHTAGEHHQNPFKLPAPQKSILKMNMEIFRRTAASKFWLSDHSLYLNHVFKATRSPISEKANYGQKARENFLMRSTVIIQQHRRNHKEDSLGQRSTLTLLLSLITLFKLRRWVTVRGVNRQGVGVGAGLKNYHRQQRGFQSCPTCSWSELLEPRGQGMGSRHTQKHSWLQSLGGKESSAAAAAAKSFQSCPTLCDPIDGSPPGSPIPGILQARTLEWIAIFFSNAWKWILESN